MQRVEGCGASSGLTSVAEEVSGGWVESELTALGLGAALFPQPSVVDVDSSREGSDAGSGRGDPIDESQRTPDSPGTSVDELLQESGEMGR